MGGGPLGEIARIDRGPAACQGQRVVPVAHRRTGAAAPLAPGSQRWSRAAWQPVGAGRWLAARVDQEAG